MSRKQIMDNQKGKQNMIEARWYGSLVMSLEDMGGPIILNTETDDIVDACAAAHEYERKSNGCLEYESYDLYRDGKRITEDEMIAAFDERYPEVAE